MQIISRPASAGLLLSLAFATLSAAPGAAAEEAAFVGSESCAACHPAEQAAWLESDHRQAMLPAGAGSVRGNFDDVRVTFHGVESRLFRDPERYRVTTAGPGGERATFDIAYTFGHYPVQQYLVDIGNGYLQALNLAWDSRAGEAGGQRWYHLRADEKIDANHPFFWTRHFQNANSRCIECHSTGFAKNFDPESAAYSTAWAEPGVGCEACHGPASRHLELAAANRLDAADSGFERKPAAGLTWSFRDGEAIASPSGTRDDSWVDTCGGCHSRRGSLGDPKPGAGYHQQYRLALLERGLYFADGQIDDEVFVAGSFLQSRMHARGVTCGNCHDPHSGKPLAQGNALCAQCHQPAVYDSEKHHRHPSGSGGAQCVNCHMPARLYMQVDWRRDHRISRPDPWLSQRLGVPNACTGCHRDRDDAWAAAAMRGWGLEPGPAAWAAANHGIARQDMLAFREFAADPAALGLPPIRQATLLAGLAGFPTRLALETAAGYLHDPDPLLRRAAVTALQPFPAELRWQLLSPLIDDPVKSVRLEAAELLADLRPRLNGADADRLDRLLGEYRESLAYRADSPGGQLAIGNLESRLGFTILAERAFRSALDIEPRFVPALLNLSDLYRSLGSDGEARELLQRALEFAPDDANVDHAWGLYLVRAGRRDEAREYFARALEQENATPRHAYVYAVALDSAGRTADAIAALDRATERWPNTLDLYFLQVSYMDKAGRAAGIERYLGLLATVAGNNPQIRNWINKYGLDQP
ncbi:MAG: tetratricopeptide repeat protein [Gammaproteobacteria bacterium]|jgi:tetratricopeptide (TPR) repeat protein